MSNVSSWVARQRAPFTVVLAATLVLFSFLGWATQGRALLPLMFDGPERPWAFLTYPWAFSPLASPFGLLFLILLVMWLVQFGGALEREMGTLRVTLFWGVATILFAVVAMIFGLSLAGPMLPGCALVLLWCARNRTMSILLWGLLPLSGLLLAAILALSVVFVYGAGNPLHGIAMALPLGLVWLYGLEKLPIAVTGGPRMRPREQPVVKGGTKYDAQYYEDVKKREIEREEQERLRKLFEGK